MKIKQDSIYINYDLCKKCGGKCCLKSGCTYSPDNFSMLSYDNLKKLMATGNISISAQFCVEKKFTSYFLFLHARNKDRGIIDLFSPKNCCALLTDQGCPYSPSERPQAGYLFIPREDGLCTGLYTNEVGLEEWSPYQKILERYVRFSTGMSVDTKLREDITETIFQLYIEKCEIQNGQLILQKDRLNESEKEILYCLGFIVPMYKKEIIEGLAKARQKLILPQK